MSIGITNIAGQEISVGDAVLYVTTKGLKRKGIITQFRVDDHQVWSTVDKKWVIKEVWVPLVYSWNYWNKGGFARWLKNMDMVFPIDETADEIQQEMINT